MTFSEKYESVGSCKNIRIPTHRHSFRGVFMPFFHSLLERFFVNENENLDYFFIAESATQNISPKLMLR